MNTYEVYDDCVKNRAINLASKNTKSGCHYSITIQCWALLKQMWRRIFRIGRRFQAICLWPHDAQGKDRHKTQTDEMNREENESRWTDLT